MSECNVTFEPKRLSSDNLLVEEALHTKRTFLCFKRHTIMTQDTLNSHITNIIKCCLTHRLDTYRIHLDRLRGAQLIKKIAHRTNYTDLSLTQIVGIVWSSLSVLHHFHIRLLPFKSCKAMLRKRQYKFAVEAYTEVLVMLLPSMFPTVIQSLITFFNESMIWNLEKLIVVILMKLLEVYKDNETVIDHLLDIIDQSKPNDKDEDARSILKVLYTLLNHIDWKTRDQEIVIIHRMLEMYRRNTLEYGCVSLKGGYEACLQHALRHMKRSDIINAIRIMLEWTHTLQEKAILQIGNLLEYIASLHSVDESYLMSISDEILPVVLDLVSSDNVYISLLGNRVLYYMLERSDNNILLMTPRIYFQNVEVNLKIGKYNMEDKHFLQAHHSVLHTNLMASVVKHASSKINLECTFANIAVIAVEVPCGYTAAATVCIAMAIQEYALESEQLGMDTVYQIHACIMYIMSLICHIHNAKTFYDYVNAVLLRRAKMAPHLNPPLKQLYENHSVHLRKPELYFEDWEARYGLWKCFISSSST